MAPSWFDPLSAAEKKSFEARSKRLAGPFSTSVKNATAALTDNWSLDETLLIRSAFSYLDNPPPDEDAASDRRAPARASRPSATRISSSQGIALRLYLTALIIAQSGKRPGRQGKLPALDLISYTGETGWSDLIATEAVSSDSLKTRVVAREKKRRSLHNALKTLNAAGLVDLSSSTTKYTRYENFSLIHEAGTHLGGDPRPYTVPKGHKEEAFTLPAEFFSQGWVHVLADSEITVLLMVACAKGALNSVEGVHGIRGTQVAIPANERLLRYGIHRDPFSRACKTLEWFGLIEVERVRRHLDGRAEDADLNLNRLKLLNEGFRQDALEVTESVINRRF